MTFAMSRGSYDRYMGRYSDKLASAFVPFVGVQPGMRALDVGCGPGALTQELAGRLGAARVGRGPVGVATGGVCGPGIRG